MPRFTVKDLLIAMTLFAIGVGMLASLFQGMIDVPRGPSSGPMDVVVALVYLASVFGSGPLIGAGLFTPFKRAWIGVAVGFVSQFVLLFLLVLCLGG